MNEELSLVTNPKNDFDIRTLQNPLLFEEFLDQPASFIAETLTGALGEGSKGLSAAGGRIVQAIFKGRLFTQWAIEFRKLRKSGQIPSDFAEKKHGFQTWVELMTIIDEEGPDDERLEALKAMFYAVNNVNATDGDRIAAYQMWQIAKSLTSGELFLLRTIRIMPEQSDSNGDFNRWTQCVARAAGHNIPHLVVIHEKKLTELALLSDRTYGDGSGIRWINGRLTDFGMRFCQTIETYHVKSENSDA